MEEKKELKKLELVHQQDTYKIIIPQEVEKKIRLLCREIHNVEWSGILFYDISGKFEDGSLTVTCVDLLQMDEGTGGYTEYDMNADVANYIVDHPELVGVYQGLIHSHNNMPTFFSGTDTSTLQSEGSDMNHFVSLIVNNAGKYTAGITRKVKGKRVITDKYSYPTWNDKVEECSKTYEKDVECIEWFNLTIEIEGASNDFEKEMLDRIKEIRTNKAAIQRTTTYSPYSYGKTPNSTGSYVPIGQYGKQNVVKEVKAGPANFVNEPKVKQPELPFNKADEDPFIDYQNLKLNPSIIDWVVKQTLTCSVIIPNNSVIDKDKWARSMDKLYTERFNTVDEFKSFASNFVDYLVNSTEDPEALRYMETDEMSAVLAYNVNQELAKLPKNKWIDIWMSMYDDYII